ncbi:histidine kinase [Streptomyces sp. 15-116A]|uniref:histidine kinase n=1 Tax=Streptomyces sp. 15-116A TaxID=2259035 RepID=UPI0021B1C361|nr:histidine kinase [Streptomyces sp. 15-116A]MCT7355474.1 histidine kinase [Streptomyces sp. 15-116A]
MREPGGWWRRKSTPAKVETYTRWSFHFFGVVEVLFVGLPAVGALGPRLGSLLLATVCAHAAMCMVIVSRALDWTRGRRRQPVLLLWLLGAASVVIAFGAQAIVQHGPDSADVGTAAGAVFGVVLILGAGIIALALSRRHVIPLVLGFAAGAGLVSLLVGAPATAAAITALVVLLGAGFMAFTAVLSVWLLNIVYELDEARETRARLAVAEERLRFARDLHDVMGRNLAVLALKSELAVQLAQRGRPEAVDQMTEVQRLAHEAQREIRELVRGYREADLGAEIAGAQGVLQAAGITCTITGSPAGLPDSVQSALGWVMREAATNVLRHGDARHCTVELKVTEGHAVLSVENDGVREDRSSGGTGSGLAGLRERLSGLDGTLEAGPVGDGCFRLTAEVPLPRQVSRPVREAAS